MRFKPKRLRDYIKMPPQEYARRKCKLEAEYKKTECDLTHSRYGSKRYMKAGKKIQNISGEFHKIYYAEKRRKELKKKK